MKRQVLCRNNLIHSNAEHVDHRCVDSGLWVPGGGEKVHNDPEETYEEIKDETTASAESAATEDDQKPNSAGEGSVV